MDIVLEAIVRAQCDPGAETETVREENLCCCVVPDLEKVQEREENVSESTESD